MIHVQVQVHDGYPWPQALCVGPGRRASGYLAAMASQRALVRRPSTRLAEGLVTHIERTPVDSDLAAYQWQQYVDALGGAGWTCVEVAPIEECPDGVFIEDTM